MKSLRFAALAITVSVLTFVEAVPAQCLGKQIQIFRRLFPSDVITADFNHDGIPDVATSTINSGHPSYRGLVSIFLGDGKGTFKRPGSRYYEASGVEGLAAGDFNNDGNLDVIDVNTDLIPGPEGVGIFLGNGDGTSGQHIHHEADYLLDHVAVGNFNGDGNLDAIVSSRNYISSQGPGFLGVLMGQGDGTLIGPFPVPTAAVKTPWAVLTGDFNGDGISDFVLLPATVPLNRFEVRIGNGDGTFHLGGVYWTHARSSRLIVQGDFNEDGVIDLAVADFSSPSGVEIFLGNGDGTFQPSVKYGTRNAEQMVTADFNGDGHLDLLTMRMPVGYSKYGGWTIQLGNGDGTFQAPVDHDNMTEDPWAIVAADFNQDGFADLVVSDLGTLAVFPNLGNCP